ncbi:hypothetical protein QOZ80_2BG0160840 [Eleusine coracana subsp. coracana]|nr:hypothetical protein QOZ80_2BG0160840 [Eleusine coracana subsp. coracana]
MNGGGGDAGEGGSKQAAAGGGSGGAVGPVRVPTWRERENNRLRERRRRAIAAKIFTGLRKYGNYQLPKHCDNNEVLKAVCNEAGWAVEPDGTTYRRGMKPPGAGQHTGIFRSGTVSPVPSSYQLSSRASYNPSPTSSSSHITLGGGSSSHNFFFGGPSSGGVDGASSFIPFPWLKTMTTTTSAAAGFPTTFGAASHSAPVTPPTSVSPPSFNVTRWADNRVPPAQPLAPWPATTGAAAAHQALPPWAASGSRFGAAALPAAHTTTPMTPRTLANSSLARAAEQPTNWLPGSLQLQLQLQTPPPSSVNKGKSPAFSFGTGGASSSRMGASGRPSSPAFFGVAAPDAAEKKKAKVAAEQEQEEMDDGCELSLGGREAMVRAWEGEVVKDYGSGETELELTLGSARTRADPPRRN